MDALHEKKLPLHFEIVQRSYKSSEVKLWNMINAISQGWKHGHFHMNYVAALCKEEQLLIIDLCQMSYETIGDLTLKRL